ncbi:MAG TPA: choice-of-anchor E domain-containing protein, partial [Chitinophagaceae bacterium]|nr:choice-of-anchor E domain-containing protein [Chitinophagaceae bacterium]
MKRCELVRASICLFVFGLIFTSTVYSQCANGTSPYSISYDTLFNGGGNTRYDLTMPQFDTNRFYIRVPQFDLSKGTLIKVELATFITVKNTYEVENKDLVASFSRVRVVRSDIITSPVLVGEYEFNETKTIGNHTLGAVDGTIGSGPDFLTRGLFYSYNRVPITYTLNSNLAGFMGNGDVVFNYETTTDLYSSGSNNNFSSSTEDSVTFRLTYYYCLTSLLPADITNFSATKLTTGNVQLNWNTPNDIAGKRYELQKSTDARNFTSFETFIAKNGLGNTYSVSYTPTREDKDKIFFRIKQFEADGSLKYSSIKIIKLDYVSTAMRLFPTVTQSRVNVYFPYALKSDYRVTVTSITG